MLLSSSTNNLLNFSFLSFGCNATPHASHVSQYSLIANPRPHQLAENASSLTHYTDLCSASASEMEAREMSCLHTGTGEILVLQSTTSYGSSLPSPQSSASKDPHRFVESGDYSLISDQEQGVNTYVQEDEMGQMHFVPGGREGQGRNPLQDAWH